jgi:hypothetical protein
MTAGCAILFFWEKYFKNIIITIIAITWGAVGDSLLEKLLKKIRSRSSSKRIEGVKIICFLTDNYVNAGNTPKSKVPNMY